MRALLIALMALPSVAQAQTSWTDHARVSINFGVPPSPSSFTGATSKPVYLETSTVTTAYSVPKGQFFDGGVLIRVKRGFGLGVAVSSFSKSQSATVTGSVPHPFFFNTPRSISGTAPGLARNELAVHIQAAYVVSGPRVDVAISGGPTFFNVSQDLVADVTFSETYPYDTAAFGTATVTKVSATKLGFNAGVDVGVKFSKKVGVGGLVRFSRASITFPLANTTNGVATDAGGVQAGGGVRFYF